MKDVVTLAMGGAATSTGTFGEALNALKLSADRTSLRLQYCLTEADSDFLIDFGPAVGRRFAEEITSILCGRLDPLRIIVSLQGARSVDFTNGNLNPSSLTWSGDVLPPFDPTADNKPWSQKSVRKNGIVRGVLSGQLAISVFESGFYPAVDFMVANVSSTQVPRWMTDVQKLSEGVFLLADLRQRISLAYSHLSKGIHFEFMPVSGSAIEPDEIKRLLGEMIYTLATTALVVNFSGLAHGGMNPKESCDLYFSASKNAPK